MDGDTAYYSRLPLTYSSGVSNNDLIPPFKKVLYEKKLANKIKYDYTPRNICFNRNRITEPNSDTYLGIKTKKCEKSEVSRKHLRKNSLNLKTLKNKLSSHKVGKSRTKEKSPKCHQNILKYDEGKHAKKESGNCLSSSIFSEIKCHKTNPSDLFGFRRCNRRRQNFDYNMSVMYKLLEKDNQNKNSHYDVLRCRHCSFEDVPQENSKKKSPLDQCISEVPTRYTLINFSQCSTSSDTFMLKPEGLNQTKPKNTFDASSSLSISNTNKSILKRADSVKSVYTQPMRIKTKQRKLATTDCSTRRLRLLKTTVGNMFHHSKANYKRSKHGVHVEKCTSSNKTRKGVRMSLKPLPFLKTFIKHFLSLVVVIVWLPCIVIIGFFWLISYPFRPQQYSENVNYEKQFHTQSNRNKNKRYSNRSKSNSRTKSPAQVPFNISVHSHKKNMKCKVKLRKMSARKKKRAHNKSGARFFYSATTALAFPGEGFQPCNTKKKKKSVTFEDSFEKCDSFFPKDDLEGSFMCPEGRFELQSRFEKEFGIPTDAKKEEAQLDCQKYLEQKKRCELKRRQFEVGVPKIIPKLIKSTLCQNNSTNNFSNLKQLPTNEKNYSVTCIEPARINNDCNKNIENRCWSNSPVCSEEFCRTSQLNTCPTQNYSPISKKRSFQKSVQVSTGKSTTVIKFIPLPRRKTDKQKEKTKKEKPPKKPKEGTKKLKQSKNASNKKKTSKEGTRKQKPLKEGTKKQKPSKDGSNKKKPSKGGSTKQKSSKNESSKKKPSKDGTNKQKPSKEQTNKQKPLKEGGVKQKVPKDKTTKQKVPKDNTKKQKPSKEETNKQKRLKGKEVDKKRQKIKSISVLKFFPYPRPRMRSVSSNVSLPNSPQKTKIETQTSSTNTNTIKTTSVIKFFPAPQQDHKASCNKVESKVSATDGLKSLKNRTISTVTPFLNKTTSVIKFFPSPCRNKHVQFHESKSSEFFKSSRFKANEISSAPSKSPKPPKTTTVVKFFPPPRKSRDETSTSSQPLSRQTKTIATDTIGFTLGSRTSTSATNTDPQKTRTPTSIVKFFPQPHSSRRTSSAGITRSDLLKKTQVYKMTSGSNERGKDKHEKSEKSEKAKRTRSKKIETCKATQVIKFFPQPYPRTRTSVVSARPIEADKAKSESKTSTSIIKFFPPPRHETRNLTTSTHTYQKTKKTATNMPTRIIQFFPSPQKYSRSIRSSFLRTKSDKDKIKKTDRKSKNSSDKRKKENEKAKVRDGEIFSVRKYYLRKKRTCKPIADSTCKEKKVKRIKSQDKLASSKSCKINKKEKAKKEPMICGTRKKIVIKKDKKNLDYKTGHRIRSVRKYYLEKLPVSPMPVCTTCPMCQTKNAILKGSHPGISSSSSLRGDKKSNLKEKGTPDKKIDKGKKGPGKSKITQNNFAASVIKYIPPRRIQKRTITVNTPIRKIKSRRTQSRHVQDFKPKLVDKKKILRRRKLKRCLLSRLRKGEADDIEIDEKKKKRRIRFGKAKNLFVKFVDTTQIQGQDEATCNLTGGSQKRPCQWIYDHFPSVYPAFLVLYKVYNNTVHVFFFLLAAIIWCPLFCWCFLFYFVIFRRLLCS